MKQVLIMTNAITLCVVLFMGCGPTNNCVNKYPIAGCNQSGGLDLDVARVLVRNYGLNHWPAVNQNCTSLTQNNTNNGDPNYPLQDSRSVWFSLETLKSFINTIELKTSDLYMKNPSAPPLPLLGIRIYYGEYPKEITTDGKWVMQALNIVPPLPTTYAGLHTVVMIPTYFNGKVDMDFDPDYYDPGTFLPRTIDTGDATILAQVPQPLVVDMQNHGSLDPPPSDAVTGARTCRGSIFMNFADVKGCYP